MNSIVLRNIQAKLDSFELKDIHLAIPKGAIVGLIGRNGAGKTTLMKTIMGARFVLSGELEINGHTYASNEKAIREDIAVVYDVFNVNPYIKGKKIFKVYKTSHPKFDEALFMHMKETFALDLNVPIVKLSLGMQKKLMVAFALAVHPKVLLLDEPTIGIDPIDKDMIIQMIQHYMESEDNTLIFSSHHIVDVERIADYICFIESGKITLFEDKETLLSSYVLCKLDNNNEHVSALIGSKVSAFGTEGILKKEEAIRRNVEHQRATLEQIFIHLCGKGASV